MERKIWNRSITMDEVASDNDAADPGDAAAAVFANRSHHEPGVNALHPTPFDRVTTTTRVNRALTRNPHYKRQEMDGEAERLLFRSSVHRGSFLVLAMKPWALAFLRPCPTVSLSESVP